MHVLFVLVPLALVIVVFTLAAFVWATRRGQFEDLETPAIRVLSDDVRRRDVVHDQGADHGHNAPPKR
ncbi:MAG: cbb3-type cytochrome oxidase assembly protein CcoS [Myxococcota bacterium]